MLNMAGESIYDLWVYIVIVYAGIAMALVIQETSCAHCHCIIYIMALKWTTFTVAGLMLCRIEIRSIFV